jgi:hypothetical protein
MRRERRTRRVKESKDHIWIRFFCFPCILAAKILNFSIIAWKRMRRERRERRAEGKESKEGGEGRKESEEGR